MSTGHGRLERRELRVSAALTGYSPMPGIAQVAELRSRITVLKTQQVREQVRYLFTSLTPEAADADRLLTLSRAHWRIENTCVHVKDDSFGEDRQVLQRHQAGAVLAALRSTAHALLRGSCPLWTPTAPMTARAEWVSARPTTILAALERLLKGPDTMVRVVDASLIPS
ncbi:MAG: transposase [Chloroflexota bacterium]|nr:transposase [Chloroflexota bacterium]